MPDDLSSRRVALDLLTAVLRRRRPLDEGLEQDRAFAALAERDRAFVRLLVVTALRRLGQIDALIAGCLDRPLPRKAAAAHDILRLGAAQLLFLGTPPHAAVATSVDLAKAVGADAHKALINAVLRRHDREGREIAAGQDAALLNTPDWLWHSWTAAYGEETARAVALAHLREPPLDLSVKGDATEWAERLGAALLPTGSLRLSAAGRVTALPGYEEGAWWVQDAAAALPARLLGDVAGKRVGDLGAAPGGKTAQLAAAGARVTAVERSERRLERLRGNLGRLRLAADLVAADAARWRPDEPFDAVLLDAPCSSTGTLRRHPDVAWLKTPDDVAKLAVAQTTLLAAAVDMVGTGGTVVYCVCSLQPEEGPQRIDALIATGAPVRRVAIAPDEIGGLAEAITAEGDLRTLPCHLGDAGGMDGFYAARLVRL
ncbi:MAG: MFS transporter [Rhodospirillales bacterium]|nr:MFS transporter [Rhodospirillales bacterium]